MVIQKVIVRIDDDTEKESDVSVVRRLNPFCVTVRQERGDE